MAPRKPAKKPAQRAASKTTAASAKITAANKTNPQEDKAKVINESFDTSTNKPGKNGNTNTMILQVDEATRGIMEEIKAGITDGLSSGNQTESLKQIIDAISELDLNVSGCISTAGEAKKSASEAAENADEVKAYVMKIAKDVKKLSDEQKQIKVKLDEILTLLKSE